ncbi:hypothetical protein Ct61P_09774 [Colletotrichum tofieldiae]|nr:hypothetical protein Ct61P_09774 [Colletotrichum tofieldiae]
MPLLSRNLISSQQCPGSSLEADYAIGLFVQELKVISNASSQQHSTDSRLETLNFPRCLNRFLLLGNELLPDQEPSNRCLDFADRSGMTGQLRSLVSYLIADLLGPNDTLELQDIGFQHLPQAFLIGHFFTVNPLLLGLFGLRGCGLDAEVGPHVAETGHANPEFIETLLHGFELMVLELKLSDEVADTEVDYALSEEKPTQSVNTVDDFGNVLLLVQVDQLESEEVWEFDFVQVSEEDGNVVGVSKLQLLMPENTKSSVGVESLDNLRECDSVAKGLL